VLEVRRAADSLFLLTWVRLALLLRDIRTRSWDEAKRALVQALRMESSMRRRAWRN
jgi:hypothetical protein